MWIILPPLLNVKKITFGKTLKLDTEITPTLREEGMVREAVKAIGESAKTGQIGDGKIFVSAVEEAIRIRTGESGDEAI